MLKLIVSIFLLSASYAQEQFACMRTESGIIDSSRQMEINMLRGGF